MNRRGQVTSIIAFVVVIIIMLFAAPMLMKVVTVPTDRFMTALSSVDASNNSVAAVSSIKNTFTTTFDWVVIFLFMINVIILLVSAFLVDVHPAFIVIYIFGLFFLFVFAPQVIDVVKDFYDSSTTVGSEFATEVGYLPLTKFLVDYFSVVVLAVAFLSGLIMYGKFKFSGGKSGSW